MELDAYEILVSLKDLSEQGFHRVEGNMAALEAQTKTAKLHTDALNSAQVRHAATLEKYGANSAQAALSAEKLSKAESQVAKDAAEAEGKGGGGGLLGMIGGLVGIPGPAAVAVAALGGLVVGGNALLHTYEDTQANIKAVTIAAQDHGIALDKMNEHVEATISATEQYAFSADDTRGAIAKLTEAGMSLADQQSSMNHIMDLARAKHMSLTDTAKMYELALMGNGRALKDLGIALPKLTDATALHDAAQKAVTKDTDQLKAAQNNLAAVEASLAGKHHITAAEALRLQQAHEKVSAAGLQLHKDELKLSNTMSEAAVKADRLKQVNDGVTKAVDGQRNAVTPLQRAQTLLGNVWDELAQAVGPGLEDLMTRLIDGFSVFLTWVNQFIHQAGPGISAVFGHIGDVVNTVIGIVSKLLGVLGDVIGKVADVGKAIANSPIGSIAGGVGGAVGGIGGFIGGLIPHFATGGVVSRPTVALLGEGGEREYVIPESRMARQSRDIVVHTHLYIDGREVADMVQRHLGNDLALGGTLAGALGGI